MKTREVRGGIPPQRVEDKKAPGKKGAFAKVLEEKSPEKAPEPGAQLVPGLQPRTEKVETAAPVTPAPREVDAVANEIAVAVRGANTVEVLFDSKTLAGLHIRISKDEGRLQVRLQTQSAEVARLMSQNVEALTQRLEARGYPAPVVQVRTAAAVAPASQGREERSARDEGGQGQRREKQR